jgi:hypothetical protein
MQFIFQLLHLARRVKFEEGYGGASAYSLVT